MAQKTPEEKRAYQKQYSIDNAEKKKQYMKQYRIDNAEKIKQYRIDNAEKIKQYRIDNAEKIKQCKKQYRIDNAEKIIAQNAERRAGRIKRIPKWYESLLVNEKYKKSQELEGDWHVDHIVPLTNPLVCGLHCNDNLQIIPAIENLKKHNTFIVD